MKVKFTVPASRLMYAIFVEPNSQWQRPQHFVCKDLEVGDKFACISRLVENRLVTPLGLGNLELEKSVAKTLVETVEKGSEKERSQVWHGVANLLQRSFIEVELHLKQEYVDFIKEVVTHYGKQQNPSSLAVGMSDLNNALNGRAPCSDSMAVLDVPEEEALEVPADEPKPKGKKDKAKSE